jgi:ribonuclease P protein component
MNKKDFEEVRVKGKFFRYNYFLISSLDKKDKSKPELGIVVSKKISTKAVIRNKIRRQIKEILRTNNLLKDGVIYVVVVKSGIMHTSFDTIQKDLIHAFENI